MEYKVNTNCILYKGLKVKLYKRCNYCDHNFLDCLGTQYNIVILITFTLLLILPYLIDYPLLFRVSVLLIVVILVVLGFLVNAKTDVLYLSEFDLKKKSSEMEDMNRELSALNESMTARTQELTRANKELRKLDQMKSDFISMVSHEFRSPLTSIKAFSRILLNNREQVSEEERSDFLRIIDQESDRLTRMINDVLDLSKLEAGKMQFDMQQVSLCDVVTRSVESIRPLSKDKKIRMETDLEPDLPRVMGDPDRLFQVVTNLLSNAVKFAPEGGEIKIHVGSKDSGIQITVEDNGPGIPEDQIEEIFSKFKQGGNALTDKPGGTGLGLSICKEIVHAHHGKIWAESTVGRGSRFHIAFPVLQEELSRAAG